MASTVIKGQNPILEIMKRQNNPIKNVPRLRIGFLLGIVAAKWSMHHGHRRIRVHLPASKRYLADELSELFGGVTHTVSRPGKNEAVVWQVTAIKSFGMLRQAARRVKSGLPAEFLDGLTGFLDRMLH
jgi:hypothetical protein